MRFVSVAARFLAVVLLPSGVASLPAAAPAASLQPLGAATITVDELHPGQTGTVWTVFRGTEPEPFEVQVTGVIRNALGPGKSLILCELTDERVQKMGAVAGMSGSPLYIDGRLAGALSYQVQRFETVRYAGFTPISDLLEVGEKADQAAARRTAPGVGNIAEIPATSPAFATAASAAHSFPRQPAAGSNGSASASAASASGLQPLTPVFAASGLSPQVVEMFAPRFAALGVQLSSLGGGALPRSASTAGDQAAATALRPGDAVAVAVATGDITLAATGTVSHVADGRVLAFGHPMMSLGDVELPMATSEIVAILPSSLSSFKVSNTGTIIGTVSQDRLSAISGEIGRTPPMIPVEIEVVVHGQTQRSLRFEVARHPQLTPLVVGAGAAQSVLGNNDSGLAAGLRLAAEFRFPDGTVLPTTTVLAGPQGIAQGLNAFAADLSVLLQNPWAETYPASMHLRVEPLTENPLTVLESVQLSRSVIAPGESLVVSLSTRDFQGSTHREQLTIPIPAGWSGKNLEVVISSGPDLDALTGLRGVAASQIRSFTAFADLVRRTRAADGLFVAVVESTSLFVGEASATPDLPGSFSRIARAADDTRFQQRSAVAPLWEQRLLPGRLVPGTVRRPVRVTD